VLSGLRLTSADEAAAVEGYRDDLLLRRTRVVRAARPPEPEPEPEPEP